MQLINPDINLDIIGKRRIALVFSLALIAASIVSLVMHGGPLYGVDFAGGTVVQVQFSEPVSAQQIRSSLAPLGMESATVQRFGLENNEYRIRTDEVAEGGEGHKPEQIKDALAKATGLGVNIRSVEMVGPQVGKDLREKALLAMLYALLFITVYISGRFELKWIPSAVMAILVFGIVTFLNLGGVSIPLQIIAALVVAVGGFIVLKLRFGMGAIAALLHDVIITVGVFTIFNKEFNLPTIAALLTIVGYSLNDTIIVFDRIRENTRKLVREPLEIIINKSINQTLSRTLLTSGTTLIVVLALYVLGGGVIQEFAFALIIGVIVGTYSSIYVASPFLLAWQKSAARK
ncbi:MAG: protein translocase subunit SecF [Deltaproteobacteria bacterium]|nr:protein translocase subunit SecF [Deltaproteobacteria bacterium]